ncbi:response regulator receiver protein [Arthrobacter crusticola]|uniref:Response regulator receiver protein n=1 Tax=Arthrobacter crusticola TaxID=2547960 RepID=A0A4R5TZZ3_9MICC|nr:BTAD domain-containing putative transcriptional regulator [Arthrobacter crusticola]TDK26877.1 response regulator receiver protein [Arthrobacter crusticola]
MSLDKLKNHSEPEAEFPRSISVNLIGDFSVTRGDGTVLRAGDLGGLKTRQIFELLLLRLGSPISKDRLIEVLWGGRAPNGAVATLESYVSMLRRIIQPGHARTGPLRTATGGYLLDAKLVDLDYARFQHLVRSAERCQPADALPRLLTALELCTRPLLGHELTAEWAEEARLGHAAAAQEVRLKAAETASLLGRTTESIRLAQEALSADQLSERAWISMILGLEHAGMAAEGLSAFERCRRVFATHLGCEPGPVLKGAHRRLLHQTAEADPDLSEEVAALLYLGGRLNGTGGSRSLDSGREWTSEIAGRILHNFIQRAHEAS